MDALGTPWRASVAPATVVAISGEPVAVEVTIDNRADVRLVARLRWVGLDADAVLGLRLIELRAGERTTFTQELTLGSAGVDADRALALEIVDEHGVSRLCPLHVRNGSNAGLHLWAEPAAATGRFRGRTVLHAVNRGGSAQTLRLHGEASALRVRLAEDQVVVQPGQELTIKAKASARPRLGRDERRSVVRFDAVADGPATHATFTFVQAGLMPAVGRKMIALVLLLGLWAGVLSGGITMTRHLQVEGANAEGPGEQLARTDDGAADGAAGGADADGDGKVDAPADGVGGAAGAGGEDGDGAAGPTGVEISGTVKLHNESAEGVIVQLRPVSISADTTPTPSAKPLGMGEGAATDAAARDSGAGPQNRIEASDAAAWSPAPPTVIRAAGDRAAGKLWSEALAEVPSALGELRTTTADADGAWGFAAVPSPGVYELLFAQAGYRSESYVVTTAEAGKPVLLDVDLVPGDGALGGRVTGPGGPLGGVDVTITDGVVTYRTATATEGDVGSWSLPQVGTPARYLVTFSRRGFGTESLAVALATGASESSLSIALVPGVGSLAGTVSHGGVPLGNVTVSATNGTVTRATTTLSEGAPGSFLLPQLPIPATYTVTVSRPGYLSQTLTVELKGATDAIDVVLVSSTAVISGVVTEAPALGDPSGGGAGLAGVGIDVTNGTNTFKSTSTLTPAGHFELGGLPPGTYSVVFTRFEYVSASVLVTVAAGERRRLDVPLERKAQASVPRDAKLQGTVFSALDGLGLAGATVAITGTTPPAVATTDTTGYFELTDLALGTYTVEIAGPGSPRHQTVTRKVRLGVGATERLDVTLVPLGSLIGHVTDNAGRAIDGVEVLVLDSNGNVIPTASEQTRNGGDFNIKAVLSSGSYTARFRISGYQQKDIGFSAVVGDTVRVDAQLSRLPTLAGRVLRPTGSTQAPFDGLGSAGVQVSWAPSNVGAAPVPAVVQVSADANGFYAVAAGQLAVGTWVVTATPPPAAPYAAISTTVGLSLDQNAQIDLVATPTAGVAGEAYWIDANGVSVAVSGLTVAVTNAVTGWTPGPSGTQVPVRADLSGVADSSSKAWTVSGHVADVATYHFSGNGVIGVSRQVTVVAGTPTPLQSVELQPVLGGISGTVTTDPANERAGHLVRLTAAGSALDVTTTTDANGNYSFANLRPGAYLVAASHAPSWLAATPVGVNVSAGAVATAPAVLLQKYASIAVDVTDSANSASLNGATVQLYLSGGVSPLASATATTGRATFEGLVPQSGVTYEARVNLAGYAPASAGPIALTAFGQQQSVTVPLTRWSVLSGTVSGTRAGATTPLAGATVAVLASTVGAQPTQTTTDAQGAWQVGGLASGTYRVTISAAGYTNPDPPTDVVVTLGTDAVAPAAVLQSQLASFHGSVVSDSNGAPVANVVVTATGTRNGTPLSASCATDDAGVSAGVVRCQWSGVNTTAGEYGFEDFDATSVHLSFVADGHHALERDATLSVGSQQLAPITLLGNAGSISGTVRWTNANQTGLVQGTLDNATVVLTRSSGGGTVEVARVATSGGGRFSIPALGKGRYNVLVDAGDLYASQQRTGIDVNGQSDVALADFVLVADLRPVRVVVTSSPGGQPIVGATVSLTGAAAGGGGIGGTTGAGGTVTLQVPASLNPGYQLAVVAADHVDATSALTVSPAVATLDVPISMSRFGKVSGSVSASPPSANATVRVSNAVELTPLAPLTGAALQRTPDSLGAFEFTGLAAGSYRISYRNATNFTVPADEVLTVSWGTTTAATAGLYVQHAEVTVQLTGHGAPGSSFTVVSAGRPDLGPYSSGQKLYLLPNVTYRVVVEASANHNLAGDSGPLSFTPGQVVTEQVQVLGQGTARIRLKHGSADLDPSASATAVRVRSGGVDTSYTVDPDGVIVIDELSQGSHTFTVDNYSGYFDAQLTLSITAGDSAASLQLIPLGQVSGTVTSLETGATVALTVCRDSGAACVDTALASPAGSFAFSGLADGQHHVHTQAFGSCPTLTGSTFSVTKVSAYVGVQNLAVATEATFTVYVAKEGAALGSGGANVLDVTVDGNAVAATYDQATSTFTLIGVPAGTVSVTASQGNVSDSTSFTISPCQATVAPVSLDMV